MLGRASAQVQTPALRAVGNITSGTAEQTRAVLDCDVLSAALSLLHSHKKEIRKEACWMISNLTAGSAEQIDMVCQAGLMPRLVEICKAEEFDIRKEVSLGVWDGRVVDVVNGKQRLVWCMVFEDGLVGGMCDEKVRRIVEGRVLRDLSYIFIRLRPPTPYATPASGGTRRWCVFYST